MAYTKNKHPKYEAYLGSDRWKQREAACLERDHHVCQICGKPVADRGHHLTYERLGNELDTDIVSVCKPCHDQAEEFYNPELIKHGYFQIPDDSLFMAAMVEDALMLAPKVLAYIKKVRGDDFLALFALKEPTNIEHQNSWGVLQQVVRALCAKRYIHEGAENRRSIAATQVAVNVILAYIEQNVRNAVQDELQTCALEKVEANKAAHIKAFKREAAEQLNIPESALKTICDNKPSKGPFPRQTVFYYCSLAASAGQEIPPIYDMLTDEDYQQLDSTTKHARSLSA